MADVVTDRLAAAVNWTATYVNSLAASTPAGARLPIHLPTDRQCLQEVARTVGKFDPREVTFAWIRNTLALDQLLVSENLASHLQSPYPLLVGPPCQLPFDEQGNLLWPASAFAPLASCQPVRQP